MLQAGPNDISRHERPPQSGHGSRGLESTSACAGRVEGRRRQMTPSMGSTIRAVPAAKACFRVCRAVAAFLGRGRELPAVRAGGDFWNAFPPQGGVFCEGCAPARSRETVPTPICRAFAISRIESPAARSVSAWLGTTSTRGRPRRGSPRGPSVDVLDSVRSDREPCASPGRGFGCCTSLR
jgi:hypothetical protein